MNPNLDVFKRRVDEFTIGGKKFIIKELTSASDIAALKDDKDYALKVIVRCAFTEDGAQAFTDSDIPDLRAEMSLQKLNQLFRVVSKVNGMDVEEEIKNSAAVPTGG